MTITQHPVQSGAAIADHAFMEPHEIVIDVGMSDVMTDLDTIAGKSLKDRSVNAFKALKEIMETRETLTLVTRLNTYSNMMITAISADEELRTMLAMKASITLQEIKYVQVAIIPIQQTCASSKITYETGAPASGGGSSGGGYSPPVSSSGGVTTTNTGGGSTYTGSSTSGGSSTSSAGSNQSVLKGLADKLFGK